MATGKDESRSDISSAKAKRKNGWFWLGVASLAGGLLIANSFRPDSDAIMINNGSLFNVGITGSTGSLYRQTEISLNATVQQLIDSGQLDPPPGNTHKMYSIASPFNHALPETTPGSLPGDERGQQYQRQIQAGGAMVSFNQSDPTGTTSASRVIQSANSQTQASTQPIEFDTPPGVGSSTGGR